MSAGKEASSNTAGSSRHGLFTYHQEHNYRKEGTRKGGRNVGRVGIRPLEFRKVGARVPRVQKGPRKGPQFRILKILRLFENLVPP